MPDDEPHVRETVLGLHDEDGEMLRIKVMSEGLVDRRCPGCSGRFLFGFVVGDDGELVAKYDGGFPFLLHTDPPCDPFTRLSFRAVFGYLRTGEATELAPIMPSEPKPEKQRKAHHR